MSGHKYNAEEILEIACQIERNGARYYRRAAQMSDNPEISRMLLHLASMEDDHETAFERMKADSSLLAELLGFPDDQASLYLQAVAGGYLIPIDKDPSEQITPQTTIEQVLQTAIVLEKDSIVFYQGLKQAVSQELGKNKIDAIIHEEMMHAALLGAKLQILMAERSDQE
ncbi:MAG: ferritin family protein [Candidatus Alcyoniella australis]|nr:ferritin family protein [Candidatus Alcyoniella australis]